MEMAPRPITVPTALGAQVQGVDVPEGQRQKNRQRQDMVDEKHVLSSREEQSYFEMFFFFFLEDL